MFSRLSTLPWPTILAVWALFLGSLAHAQDASLFGLKLGTSFYQPQNDLPQDFPRPGADLGFSSAFGLNRSSSLVLQTEFGYRMSNTPFTIPEGNYISPLSGISIPAYTIQRSRLMLHFLNLGGSLAYRLPSENLRFWGGFEGNYLLSMTYVLEYDAGGDEPVQEITGGLQEGVTRWYINLMYGMDVRLRKGEKSQLWFYLAGLHQLDVQPWRPTGAVFGLKVYLNGLFRRKSS